VFQPPHVLYVCVCAAGVWCPCDGQVPVSQQ
jgi:hypothetical protein